MYIDYVNTKMGTDSSPRFSRGNTLALTQLPFGMVSFCPQTERLEGQREWFFSPRKPYLEGIRLTHQPSPWIDDYGTILFTPQRDVISSSPALAWSGYRIEDGELCPDYLKIKLLRSGCLFELAPTERGCAIRLSYDFDTKNVFSILNVAGNTRFKHENGIIYGTNNHHSKDDAKDFKMYFVIKPLDELSSVVIDEEACACHLSIKGKSLEARVGISYISFEMALLNLERECADKSLDEIRAEAKEAWEEKLSRIEIDATEEQKRIFYSCMYRVFLFPHKAYELDGEGTALHYSPSLGTVCKGVRYTDTGLWDTYRTQFPLFSLIAKDEYESILEGFLNDYLESGFLPRWPSIGEVGCMPSTLIDAVIADAVVKGIGTRRLHEGLLEAMIKHATTKAEDRRYGREGILDYIKYGYVPCDKYKESVNLTLDFAYGDYCIATVARTLGKAEIHEQYSRRALSYTALFDKETGFMRAKDTSGELRGDFSPYRWGGDYTESSAWHSTFSVVHDIEGLCKLFGSKEKLLSRLDELFDAKPLYEVGAYGGEIHEMTEMAQVDFGQCAISNQPSFALPYFYAYLGETKKSEKWIKKICTELFTVDAFPGDEDNGSMSAWYILSCIGKYSICPSKNEWIELTPIYKYKIK